MSNDELTFVEIKMLVIFIEKILEKIDFSEEEREMISHLKMKLVDHL